MKKLFVSVITIILTISFSVVSMAGCRGNMDHMGDKPDISVEYLSGEYAAQLIRDGAKLIFGVISDISEDSDGMTVLIISEYEFTEDNSMPNGVFIADKNMESLYVLSPEASATFLSGRSSISKALAADEFIAEAAREIITAGSTDKFYDIYIMGDWIELLIARYIP